MNNTLYSQKELKVFDEFLIPDKDIIDLQQKINNCDCTNGVENFKFNWGTSFNTGFNNIVNFEIAKRKEMDDWYDKQEELIKDEINRKLNTSYPTFEEAKNNIFLETEKNNILINAQSLQPGYSKIYWAGESGKKQNIINLKLLQIRKAEIQTGNTDNPEYPFLEFNGILFKDMNDLNQINGYLESQRKAYGENYLKSYTHENWLQILPTIVNDETYKNELLRLKNLYYNSFNRWDKLNLMQVFLNYEDFRKYASPPYVFPFYLTQFSAFQIHNLDQATRSSVENYVKNKYINKSIFDPYYDMYGPYYNVWYAREGRQEAVEMVNKKLQLREDHINSLLNNLNLKKWFLDADNDGYHAKGSAPKVQVESFGTGWREGVSKGEDCDDSDSKYKFTNLNVSLTVDNSSKPLYEVSGDFRSGDLKNFQGIHDVINRSKLSFTDKVNAHYSNYWDEFFDKYMSEEDYINNLRDFPEWTTFNDDLVNEMIDRFKQGDSNTHFTSNNLTNSMLGSDGFSSFRSDLIKLIKGKIINDVTENNPKILIEDLQGPTFRDNGGLFSWNGSYSTNLIVSNLVVNCKTFSMTAKLIMYDRFGLDNDDLYSQPSGVGGIDEYIARNSPAMRGWFILQRVKGFKPFISEVSTNLNLSNENF
jgi:hypothetical protein